MEHKSNVGLQSFLHELVVVVADALLVVEDILHVVEGVDANSPLEAFLGEMVEKVCEGSQRGSSKV